MKKNFYVFIALVLALSLFTSFPTAATVHATGTLYEIGPGKTYTNIGDMPWESLVAGDTVKIYWKSSPYYEKASICAAGTAANPITIMGVPGPAGQLPVIEGENSTSRPANGYYNENRAILHIGGGTNCTTSMPKYITIQGLEIGGIRGTFTDSHGYTDPSGWADNAAAIWVEYGENISIMNNTITNSLNGLFVASTSYGISRNILVQGNYFYNNGNQWGGSETHQSYTSAVGITFQYNHYGPLDNNADGSNLKDRSAGTIIRYNWIEGGTRELDLVDAPTETAVNGDPSYLNTFVYGNVLVKIDQGGNHQMIHFGGDSVGCPCTPGQTPTFRKNLYLYNNTLIANRDNTVGFMLSNDDETADVRNNIFYTQKGTFWLSNRQGTINLSHNYMTSGWLNYLDSGHTGTINNDGTQITGTNPGFYNLAAQDYHLASGSAAINGSTSLNATEAGFPVTMQYVTNQSSEARPVNGAVDIGSYEYNGTTPAPSPSPTPAPANLLADPGFENQASSSIAAPWALLGGAFGGVDRSLGYSHTGSNNAWLRATDTALHKIRQQIVVKQNTNYVLSGWFKTSSNNNAGKLAVQTIYGSFQEGPDIVSQTFGNLPGYTQFTLPFNSGTNTTVIVYGSMTPNGGDTWIQMDDLSVSLAGGTPTPTPTPTPTSTPTPTPAPGTNLLADPGFELQTSSTVSSPWILVSSNGGGIDLSGYSHTGSKNAFLRLNDGNLKEIKQVVAVAANKNYTLTGWLRTSSSNLNGKFGVRTTGAVNLGNQTFNSVPNYTQYTINFNSGSNTSVEVYMDLIPTVDMWIQFDDLSLSEVLPSNLIADPGFELQTSSTVSSPWILTSSNGGGIDLSGYSHTGSKNAFLRLNDGILKEIKQVVTVVANRNYTLTGWLRTSSSNINGKFGVRTTGAVNLGNQTFDSVPNYTQYTINFNSGNNTSVEVYMDLIPTVDMWIQFDDLTLQ